MSEIKKKKAINEKITLKFEVELTYEKKHNSKAKSDKDAFDYWFKTNGYIIGQPKGAVAYPKVKLIDKSVKEVEVEVKEYKRTTDEKVLRNFLIEALEEAGFKKAKNFKDLKESQDCTQFHIVGDYQGYTLWNSEQVTAQFHVYFGRQKSTSNNYYWRRNRERNYFEHLINVRDGKTIYSKIEWYTSKGRHYSGDRQQVEFRCSISDPDLKKKLADHLRKNLPNLFAGYSRK